MPGLTHTLQTYAEFQPTQFDPRGLGCDDQQNWLVAPCQTNRDACTLVRANWESMVDGFRRTDPEEKDFQIHRFGHWGPGWFEIVLCRPGSKVADEAAEIAVALDNYPVLNEEYLSELEMEEATENWDSWQCTEIAGKLGKTFGLRDSTVDFLTSNPGEFRWMLANGRDRVGCAVGIEEGVERFEFEMWTRVTMASLLRQVRAEVRSNR